MQVKEIGSEFHTMVLEKGNGIRFPRSGSLTFSGRTALETVLKKIPYAKTALLPSYCCDSMIEPFRRAGIAVNFFDVNYNNGLLVEITSKEDILLWCNYFGFQSNFPDFEGIVIEDITHSLFSNISHHSQSDYLVASVRKWEPINCGGYCSVYFEGKDPPKKFIMNKSEAMRLKAEYLSDADEQKKVEYLKAFNESNQWFANNYSGLGIDSYSKEYISHIDVKIQREIRRRNAHILYGGLQGKVDFLFAEEQMDCPLFVPVIFHNLEERTKVRKKLIEDKIYCPVHWPHPNADCKSNIYDTELSLICDQRYSEKDMERIVSVLLGIL